MSVATNIAPSMAPPASALIQPSSSLSKGGPAGGADAIAAAPTNLGAAADNERPATKLLAEYERLVRLRDDVLASRHPRIRLAPHVLAWVRANGVGSGSRGSDGGDAAVEGGTGGGAVAHLSQQETSSGPPVTTGTLTGSSKTPVVQTVLPGLGAARGQASSSAKGSEAAAVGVAADAGGVPVTGAPSTSPVAARPSSDIHPVLLEKSEDLIRNEIQLQRLRVEKSLREQMEQKKKEVAMTTGELDVADVLAKALTRVQAQEQEDALARAADGDADQGEQGARPESEDSFDNDTFYSSLHETPDPDALEPQPQEEEEQEEGEVVDDVDSIMEMDTGPEPQGGAAVSAADISSSGGSVAAWSSVPEPPTAAAPSDRPAVPGLFSVNPRPPAPAPAPPLLAVQPPASSGANAGVMGSGDVRDSDRLRSPLVRTHSLSPVAPQPAHVSPLALVRDPPAPISVDDRPPSTVQATPAQVAALRQEVSGGSSPDSSSNAAKENAQAKEKKKKKKKDKAAADRRPSPVIKLEPESPPHITAPPYKKPNKWQQRQNNRQQSQQEMRYEGAQRADSRPNDFRQRFSTVNYTQRPYGEQRFSGYEPQNGYSQAEREARPIAPPARHESEYVVERHGPGSPPLQHAPPAADGYPAAYDPSQPRLVSRPVSHGAFDDPRSSDGLLLYRDVGRGSRMSVRPEVPRDRSRSPVAFGRQTVQRVVMESPGRRYGRDYAEPARPPTGFRPPPPPPPPPSEVVYERVERVIPAGSTRRFDTYEDDSLVYQGTNTISAAGTASGFTRRVAAEPQETVTTSQYQASDYRSYRQRDYSTTRPASGAYDEPQSFTGRYVEKMQPFGGPGEYLGRSASLRPADAFPRPMVDSAGRSGGGGGEYIRMQSVRPEATSPSFVRDVPRREYAASVQPEGFRYAPPPEPPLRKEQPRNEDNMAWSSYGGSSYAADEPRYGSAPQPPYDPRHGAHSYGHPPPPPPPQQQHYSYAGSPPAPGGSGVPGLGMNMAMGLGEQHVMRREYSARPPMHSEPRYGRPLRDDEEFRVVE